MWSTGFILLVNVHVQLLYTYMLPIILIREGLYP